MTGVASGRASRTTMPTPSARATGSRINATIRVDIADEGHTRATAPA